MKTPLIENGGDTKLSDAKDPVVLYFILMSILSAYRNIHMPETTNLDL